MKMPTNTALQDALSACGLTHQECADRAHVSRGTVTRAANGSRPHRVTAEAIGRVVGVDPTQLFPHVTTRQ